MTSSFSLKAYLCFLLLCRKEVRYKFLIVLHGDDDCTMHVCSGQAEKSTVRGKDDIALEKQESVEVMKDKYSDDFDDTNSDDFNDTNGDDADCMRERMGKCRMHLEGRKVLWLLPNHCNLPCALLALFALYTPQPVVPPPTPTPYSIYSTNTLGTYSFCTIPATSLVHSLPYILYLYSIYSTNTHIAFAQSLQPASCTLCTICTLCTLLFFDILWHKSFAQSLQLLGICTLRSIY